jgi:hypothetical protein
MKFGGKNDTIPIWAISLQSSSKRINKFSVYLFIYCKSTVYFGRHNSIMVYLLNFNITYTIILTTCFDSYESSSGINF